MAPAEIAISIAAELIVVRRGSLDHPAAPMRLTQSQTDRI
jgi:xanthine/CO dehydrogenase XdhC/CoxF family maturation factor